MTTPGARHIAVIGAGISGLTATLELRRRLGDMATITVLEKNPVIGGHLRVGEVGGLPVDAGAESLLARRPEATALAESVGLGADVVAPAAVPAGIWSRGTVRAIPAGTVMGVPADLDVVRDLVDGSPLPPPVPVEPRYRLPLTGDVPIGALVTAHYGRGVVERLVEPLLGGVYAGHADRLSLDATVPALGAAARSAATLPDAVAMAQEAASGRGGPPRPPFAGIVGGIGRLPAAVAEASGADIRTGVTVRGLERTATGWRIVAGPTVAEEAIDVDGVVVAVPPPAASRLLAGVAPRAAAELATVQMASMAIVTVVVPQDAFASGAAPEASGFLVPPVEHRTIKAVTYSSVKWPWLGRLAGDLVAVRASIGRAGDVTDLQRDDADLVDVVRTDLADLAGITGPLVDWRVTRWGGALPQYAVGHLDRVDRIRAHLADLPALSGCGAVFDGVGVAACVAAAIRAAGDVVADLTTTADPERVRIEP